LIPNLLEILIRDSAQAIDLSEKIPVARTRSIDCSAEQREPFGLIPVNQISAVYESLPVRTAISWLLFMATT
jgi:hypothetical protein